MMCSMYRIALVSLGCLICVACGGSSKSDGTSDGGSGGSTGGSAGSGVAMAGGGNAGANAKCGDTPPPNGGACKSDAASNGLGNAADCSYGDDPRPQCRTFAVCSNNVWAVRSPGDECNVEPKPPTCPGSPATAGSGCVDPTLRCSYDDGSTCACSACKGGFEYPICQTIDPPQWACVKPSSGCPNPPPQAGSPCDDPDLQCGTSCELPIRCENGTWHYGVEMCPICAAPDTPIATPRGERPIAQLRVGDLVYSVDHDAILAVPVVRIGSTPVTNHRVLRLTLSSGAVLEISPNHPTASGAPLAALGHGASLGEDVELVSSELIPYAYDRTYDILPQSSTGTYFAAGAVLGSTLNRRSSNALRTSQTP